MTREKTIVGPSVLIQEQLNEAGKLLKLKSEIGRLPDSVRKGSLIDLIDDWFNQRPSHEHGLGAQGLKSQGPPNWKQLGRQERISMLESNPPSAKEAVVEPSQMNPSLQ